MLFVYPAIFHQEDASYWVEFPDLPGCHTYGSSVSEAMEEAQEALSAYLLTLLEEGRGISAPSDIQGYHPADGFPTLVSCQVEPQKSAKAVKKTLTIPAWLNERATAMGLNFSKVLQEALISKIQL